MSVVLQVATSRGNVTIASTSTADNPLVNPNWLATPSDQEVAVAGLKRARQIANATGIVVGEEFSPGTNVTSDEDILDYIRREVRPIHHAVGTCTSRPRPRPPIPLPTLPFVYSAPLEKFPSILIQDLVSNTYHAKIQVEWVPAPTPPPLLMHPVTSTASKT